MPRSLLLALLALLVLLAGCTGSSVNKRALSPAVSNATPGSQVAPRAVTPGQSSAAPASSVAKGRFYASIAPDGKLLFTSDGATLTALEVKLRCTGGTHAGGGHVSITLEPNSTSGTIFTVDGSGRFDPFSL